MRYVCTFSFLLPILLYLYIYKAALFCILRHTIMILIQIFSFHKLMSTVRVSIVRLSIFLSELSCARMPSSLFTSLPSPSLPLSPSPSPFPSLPVSLPPRSLWPCLHFFRLSLLSPLGQYERRGGILHYYIFSIPDIISSFCCSSPWLVWTRQSAT